MKRTCSPAGRALIQRFEGLRLVAYRCEGGKWTVGYGHTGPDVHEGLVIDHKRALELFTSDLHRFEEGVDALAPSWVNRHQFDAMVSFSFNVGLRAFRDSTLLRLLRKQPPDIDGAARQFGRWVRAGGKVSKGLEQRRNAERELFLRPVLRLV